MNKNNKKNEVDNNSLYPLPNAPMVDWALYYARPKPYRTPSGRLEEVPGLLVLPLGVDTPIVSPRKASTDTAQIEKWWRKFPDANIGLMAKRVSRGDEELWLLPNGSVAYEGRHWSYYSGYGELAIVIAPPSIVRGRKFQWETTETKTIRLRELGTYSPCTLEGFE